MGGKRPVTSFAGGSKISFEQSTSPIPRMGGSIDYVVGTLLTGGMSR
jgi:hypothetical protein